MTSRIHIPTSPTPEEFYRELTDPRTHDPSRFCYIVHCLNLYAQLSLLHLTLSTDSYDPSQNINLLDNPEQLADKKLISTSIINQDHTTTWGDTFFILYIPWENFVTMSPRD